MASRGRDRRGGESQGAKNADEASGHALSGLHADPRIAGAMAQRLAQRRAPKELDGAENSSGAPLPENVQRKFEGSLKADLGGVRVHTGADSAEAARSVGARAYTVGKDIHFGAGEYDPERNQELLAHEVAHTVQQSAGAHPQAKLEVASTEDPAELDADAAAARMVQGAPARVSPAAPMVHKKADPEQAKELKIELKDLIAGATWPEMRKRLYPQESAKNVENAKERKAGEKPDLTGLGQLKTLDHFAGAVKGMQASWSKTSAGDRVDELHSAINV